MPKKNQNNDNPKTTGHRMRLIWLALLIVVVAGTTGCHTSTQRRIAEQLEGLEAARAIPDSENAAVLYLKALEEHLTSPEDRRVFFGHESFRPLRTPWRRSDHLELTRWLDRQRALIRILQKASMRPRCRLLLDPVRNRGAQEGKLHGAMRYLWTPLLVCAASNDLAEGRIDAALGKYRVILQMAEHLRQHPTFEAADSGRICETQALIGLAGFIVEGDPAESHLEMIENTLARMSRTWEDDWAHMLIIQEFYEEYKRKPESLFEKIAKRFRRRHKIIPPSIEQNRIDGFHDACFSAFSMRRATRLLAALRRYSNRNGAWPADLTDLTHLARPEVFVDPINGGAFVYKTTEGQFELYSAGRNGSDEGGRRASTAGRFVGWRRLHKKDDIRFWPPGVSILAP